MPQEGIRRDPVVSTDLTFQSGTVNPAGAGNRSLQVSIGPHPEIHLGTGGVSKKFR
jgi:hypothetical protein